MLHQTSLILGGVFKDFVIVTSKIWGKFFPNVDVSTEVVQNHQVGIASTPFRPSQGAPGCLASFLRSAELVQAIWGIGTKASETTNLVESRNQSQPTQPKPTEALGYQCSNSASFNFLCVSCLFFV